eukprot:789277-Rhodomonas_salina.1
MLLCHVRYWHGDVWYCASVFCYTPPAVLHCHAPCGTKLAYAATLPGTEGAYAATLLAVLR